MRTCSLLMSLRVARQSVSSFASSAPPSKQDTPPEGPPGSNRWSTMASCGGPTAFNPANWRAHRSEGRDHRRSAEKWTPLDGQRSRSERERPPASVDEGEAHSTAQHSAAQGASSLSHMRRHAMPSDAKATRATPLYSHLRIHTSPFTPPCSHLEGDEGAPPEPPPAGGRQQRAVSCTRGPVGAAPPRLDSPPPPEGPSRDPSLPTSCVSASLLLSASPLTPSTSRSRPVAPRHAGRRRRRARPP